MTLVMTMAPGSRTMRLEVYCETAKQARRVQQQFGGSVRELKDENWAALAGDVAVPIKIRDRLVVCPARTNEEIAKARKLFPQREIIAVPPDMAFGTGHHATTASVLRLLVDAAAQKSGPWTMADLGCGSGILAIAAAKLGAARVWGCDFDPKAVLVAKENAARNGVPKLRFSEVDVLEWEPKEQWDIVAANIFADLLEQAFPQVLRAVKPGGLVMVSGILKSQADQCLKVGRKWGAVWDRVLTKGKWVSACGHVR